MHYDYDPSAPAESNTNLQLYFNSEIFPFTWNPTLFCETFFLSFINQHLYAFVWTLSAFSDLWTSSNNIIWQVNSCCIIFKIGDYGYSQIIWRMRVRLGRGNVVPSQAADVTGTRRTAASKAEGERRRSHPALKTSTGFPSLINKYFRSILGF